MCDDNNSSMWPQNVVIDFKESSKVWGLGSKVLIIIAELQSPIEVVEVAQISLVAQRIIDILLARPFKALKVSKVSS